MTRTIRTIIIATMALAVASCAKEITADVSDSRGGNPTESGKITVNVEALMGDLSPAGDETKSSIAPVVRLTWENTDVVYAYDATQCLGSLTVTPVGNGTSAKLSGEITSTDATKITLVHCNTADEAPAVTDGAISFDLSNQGEGGDPFVVWGTLDNSNQTNITGQVVPFHFATSLMRITATGLDKDITDIDSVKVSGLNTVCKLSVSDGGNPSIGGDSLGTIKKTGTDNFEKEDERTIFTVSVAFTQNSDSGSRKITVFQNAKRFGSTFSNALIDTSKSYISVYALKEADGSRAQINGHDYVLINGKRWATQNLTARTGSPGDIPFNNAIVPGTADERVKVGDYFQWGASYNGYNVTENPQPDSLLIYSAYLDAKFDGTDDNQYIFELRTDEKDPKAPFWDSSGDGHFTKYQGGGETLQLEDDAAHIILGGSWRIPSSQEFLDLCRYCFVVLDYDNKGLIFYPAKEESHKGKFYIGVEVGGEFYEVKRELIQGATSYSDCSGAEADFPSEDSYTPDDALLFFPVAGYANIDHLHRAGQVGGYWSNEVFDDIKGLFFEVDMSFLIKTRSSNSRFLGFSIRPVSD